MADSQRKIIKFTQAAIAMIFFSLLIRDVYAVEPDPFTWEAPNSLIWRNTTTGYALDGFDPVSYFSGKRPVQGSRVNEYVALGVPWLFVNKGNLEAYCADPKIYTPQFGGYDPYAMALGKIVEPNPVIWHVDGNRLYLFHTDKSKAAWINNQISLKVLARENWQKIVELARKSRSKNGKTP